ncbi:MAG TPA: hypothetical protein VFS39_01185, partial [Nitrospira sp.]|nr:hypothetical protein [Nitrospira sp.]
MTKPAVGWRINRAGHLAALDRRIAFASATFIDQRTLIAASYDALWHVDIDRGILTEIIPFADDADEFARFRAKYGWFPTGVYWQQDLRLLFVANYLANNILVFHFDMPSKRVLLKDVL